MQYMDREGAKQGFHGILKSLISMWNSEDHLCLRRTWVFTLPYWVIVEYWERLEHTLTGTNQLIQAIWLLCLEGSLARASCKGVL